MVDQRPGMTPAPVPHVPQGETSLRGLRSRSQPFPLRLEDTWLGDVVVISNAGEAMSANLGCGNVALVLLVTLPAVATVLGLLGDEPDFARVMGILTVIFVPLAVYIWWAVRRYWRVARLINLGEFERARRALGDDRSSAFGPLVALLAQLRGEHQRAAEAFSRRTAATYGKEAGIPALSPGGAAAQAGREIALSTPTARATALRACIAFATVGQLEEAERLLGAKQTIGSYCLTLEIVAKAYVALCAGGQIAADRATSEAMAAHFRAIRGAWGGLALAAFSLHQLGDAAGARAMLEEEARRPGAEYLPALLPRLGAFLQSRVG